MTRDEWMDRVILNEGVADDDLRIAEQVRLHLPATVQPHMSTPRGIRLLAWRYLPVKTLRTERLTARACAVG